MLLNEVQKQHRRIAELQAENSDLKARLEKLEKFIVINEALAKK